MERRYFLKMAGFASISYALKGCAGRFRSDSNMPDKPNIILCMSDDQGWGDVGYNGHPVLKTPNLDAMSREGMRFDRWYSGAPVCSPTRGTCLTSRHGHRYGIFGANQGHLRKQEITLAQALKTQGYTTGHFGKWHLGTLLPDYSGKGPNREPEKNYMTPGMHGFDEWFSTEYSVATWDPYDPANAHGDYDIRNLFWHNGKNVTEPLEGCSSRIVMDKAIPFIRDAAKQQRPFLAVVWFHAPHIPIIAGPEYRKMYADRPEGEQHYYGCLTAMDEQIGRLSKELQDIGIADNTMFWFCSDNGAVINRVRDRTRGSNGPFRDGKFSLFEGGVRVPGLLVWPNKIKKPRVVTMPCSSLDYYATILDVLGFRMKGQPEPIDGVSLLPMFEKKMESRPMPIGFQYRDDQLALVDNRYKIISVNGGESYMLFDLIADPGEQNDLADKYPQIILSMKEKLLEWRKSTKDSCAGKDYI